MTAIQHRPRNTKVLLISGVILVVAFAAIGTYYLSSTRAASSVLALETERGAVSGTATLVADQSASGGQAVQFKNVLTSGVVKSITWKSAQKSLWPTAESIAVTTGGKLYVFGGIGNYTNFTPARHVMVYDPATNVWTRLADMPTGLTHSGVVAIGDTIWLIAGYPERTGGGQLFNSKIVYKYHIPTDTYSRGPDLPLPSGTGGAGTANGKIYFARGTDQNRKDAPEHFMLDTRNESAGWKTLAPVQNPRNHVSYVGYNDKLFLVGGQHNQDNEAIYQNQTDKYDPATNTWTRMANMVAGKSHITAATFEAAGNIFVLGGEATTNYSQVYHIESNTWKLSTPIPTPRRTPAGGYLGNNQIILSGGDGGSGTHDETWIGTLNF